MPRNRCRSTFMSNCSDEPCNTWLKMKTKVLASCSDSLPMVLSDTGIAERSAASIFVRTTLETAPT